MALSQDALDVNSFWDYWEKLKTFIGELIQAGAELFNIQRKYEELSSRAAAVGDEELVDRIEERLLKVTDDYSLWEQIKAKIDEWLPNWMKIESSATSSSGVSGFGVAFVLPAWAIAMLIAGGLTALVFVATEGMRLLKRIYAERAIIADIERGVITAEEASKLIGTEEKKTPTSYIGETIKRLGNVAVFGAILFIGIGAYNLYSKRKG